jgi:hypothetical protein
MKTIRNLTAQKIILEGFGEILIEESYSGEWCIDLFPRNTENDRNKIFIDTSFSSTGSKYFETPKQNLNRVDEIYG